MKQMHDSIIVQTMSRLLIPLAQLFALYVLFFGQYGPGGGFVAGVIWTTSMILTFLVFGLKSPQGRLVEKALHGDGVGLIIFVGVGGLCLIGGGEFLNYANLEIPGLDAPTRRYMGILLAQIGVAVDVAVTGISIVLSLAYHDTEQEYDV
ncbi:MAG: cation:proton antiporter [Nitrospirota bacterium]|nr:cation:proton antiporter [Nitrospirota bacterium]